MADTPAKDWIVLFVDDMPDNLVIAEVALRHFGATVYTAESGKEALQMLETVRPTVILMDIRMPHMDGWELFDAVKEKPGQQHIPIIAVTAYAMDTDRAQVLAKGFDGYISKPFEVTRLVQDIKKILEQGTQAG